LKSVWKGVFGKFPRRTLFKEFATKTQPQTKNTPSSTTPEYEGKTKEALHSQ
jgi:hypothetical protein